MSYAAAPAAGAEEHDPVLLAEQALLGALLLDPGQIGAVASSLRPENFYRPVHAETYQALLELAVSDRSTELQAADPGNLPLPLAVQARVSRRLPGLSPSYTHALIARCPHPAHAAAYARMVADAALHREITEHASRLAQVAERSRDVSSVLHYLDVLTDALSKAGRSLTRPPDPAAAPARRAAALDRSGSAVATEQHVVDEQMVLALLLQNPSSLPEIARWLLPADFTEPAHSQIYACLVAVHRRDEVVDALTVLWEARHRGLLSNKELTASSVLMLSSDVVGGDADYWAWAVLQSAVLRHIGAAAAEVRRLALQPSAPEQLIRDASAALAPLRALRLRWQRAVGDAAAPGAGPGPPPLVLHATARPAKELPDRRPVPPAHRPRPRLPLSARPPPACRPGRPSAGPRLRRFPARPHRHATCGHLHRSLRAASDSPRPPGAALRDAGRRWTRGIRAPSRHRIRRPGPAAQSGTVGLPAGSDAPGVHRPPAPRRPMARRPPTSAPEPAVAVRRPRLPRTGSPNARCPLPARRPRRRARDAGFGPARTPAPRRTAGANGRKPGPAAMSNPR